MTSALSALMTRGVLPYAGSHEGLISEEDIEGNAVRTFRIFSNHFPDSPSVWFSSKWRRAAICVLTLGVPTGWIDTCTAPALCTIAPSSSLCFAPVANAVFKPARKPLVLGATIPAVTPAR